MDELPSTEVLENHKNVIGTFKRFMKMEGKSENTIYNYGGIAEHFLRFTGKKLEDITEIDLIDYLAKKVEEGMKQDSRYIHYRAIQRFFKIVGKKINWEAIPKHRYRTDRLPTALTKAQVEAIIEAAPNIKIKCMLKLSYECALRVSELCDLTIGDLDLEHAEVQIFPKKREKPVRIPITQELVHLLRQYLATIETSTPEQPLFSLKGNKKMSRVGVTQGILVPIARSLGIKTTFHQFARHSRATHLLRSGLDVFFVSKLLRHRKLESTTVYLALTTQDLRDKLENLSKPKISESP